MKKTLLLINFLLLSFVVFSQNLYFDYTNKYLEMPNWLAFFHELGGHGFYKYVKGYTNQGGMTIDYENKIRHHVGMVGTRDYDEVHKYYYGKSFNKLNLFLDSLPFDLNDLSYTIEEDSNVYKLQLINNSKNIIGIVKKIDVDYSIDNHFSFNKKDTILKIARYFFSSPDTKEIYYIDGQIVRNCYYIYPNEKFCIEFTIENINNYKNELLIEYFAYSKFQLKINRILKKNDKLYGYGKKNGKTMKTLLIKL